MHSFYAAPYKKLFQALHPHSIRVEVKEKLQTLIQLAKPKKEAAEISAALAKKSPSQKKVLDALLKAPDPLLKSDIMSEMKVSASPYKRSLKKES